MGSFDLHVALDALEDTHRRRLLVALLEHNPQEAIPVLDEVHRGDKEMEILQAEMFHTHLPKLEEAGIIRWDRDDNQVTRGPNFDDIRPLLELIDDHADELPYDWL